MTGGIASYKTVWLARLLTQAGAEVDVVMTRSAQEFVGPITFEAVTGRPVHTEIFGPGRALDHIRLAREASAVCVAPATAEFLAKAAHGHADDLLTAILLATEAPVLLVPAMNDRMWNHRQTRQNVEHLRSIGYRVIDPDEGPLAVGEGNGPGRMPEPEVILANIGRLIEPRGALSGKKVVVTAGATREAIDPVRFISNHSSGKMGIALATSAWRRGADVTLVAGHVDVALPAEFEVIQVDTTKDMLGALEKKMKNADVLVMAAAPADFAAKEPAKSKLKKSSGVKSVDLIETEDILGATRKLRKKGSVTVGFALETNNAESNGAGKLKSKHLDLIVINAANEPGAGFRSDTNRVVLLDRSGAKENLPLMPKSEVAEKIWDKVSELLGGG